MSGYPKKKTFLPPRKLVKLSEVAASQSADEWPSDQSDSEMEDESISEEDASLSEELDAIHAKLDVIIEQLKLLPGKSSSAPPN